ncbi:alternate-type signal peptide domain-containing protein [Nocardioides ungokensis]|uniref:alternate-type signal peptide domain-containing protein n=1 Tax=Nocardioides ungokensis TaxID=1643322 RepID=UPI0015DF57D8|nr:alternate-type signal peptide domain-containing protein [Nocardioides ungokensis]
MKKSTKGALAAGAAASLLLGGAGSLAYWTSTGTISQSSISSGDLSLGSADCGTGWSFDDVEGTGVLTGTSKLVPGDVLTKTCTYVITAKGDHLKADVTASTPSLTGALAGSLSASVTNIKVDGVNTTHITSADDGKSLSVTVGVTYAGTSGNTTKNLSAVLNDITVTATQSHA